MVCWSVDFSKAGSNDKMIPVIAARARKRKEDTANVR
jgi:hypothetical protein